MPALPGVVDDVARSSAEASAVSGMVLLTVAVWGGGMLVMQSEQELWLRMFKNNFAEQARVQALVNSASGLISFAANPIIAGLCDSIGRKPVMLASSAFGLVRCILPLISAGGLSRRSVIIGELLRPFMFSTWMIGRQASLGDLFKDSPRKFSAASSKIEMIGSINMIVMPMLSAVLSARDMRLPYVVASAAYCCALIFAPFVLSETLPSPQRQSFDLRKSNPATVLKLFTNGSRLRALSALEAIGSLCDGRATWQIQGLHRQQLLGWDMAQRGRYMSFASVFSVAGYGVSSVIFQKLGTSAGQLTPLQNCLFTPGLQ